MKIAFGLTNLIYDEDGNRKERYGIYELFTTLKKQGHTLILWTTKKKKQLEKIKKQVPQMISQFDEIYCLEDCEIVESIPGCSLHDFKNINKINADCMIEKKASYRLYSNNLQIGNRYCIIQEFRDFLYEEPKPAIVKLVGPEVYDLWKKRVENKEQWVYQVLNFVEKLEKSNASTSYKQ